MPNRRLGQIKGRRETILNCVITANPHATNYWEKDGRRIHSSLKHYIDTYDEGDNTLTLSLRITDLSQSDYGQYRCIAANALGRDEDVVFLFGSSPYYSYYLGLVTINLILIVNFWKINDWLIVNFD